MPTNLRNVFWNPVENRFRAGVRIVIFFALWVQGLARRIGWSVSPCAEG